MTEGLRRVFLDWPWIYRGVRSGLAILFLYAGAVKLLGPRAFARVISGYGLVPDEWLVLVAVGLPVLEVLAGVGLLFDVRGSLPAVSGMLVLFLGVLGFGILNQLDVDCGCFSPDELQAQGRLRAAFLRDVGLLGCTAYLFYWRRRRARLHRPAVSLV